MLTLSTSINVSAANMLNKMKQTVVLCIDVHKSVHALVTSQWDVFRPLSSVEKVPSS